MYDTDKRWETFLHELSRVPDRTSALDKAGIEISEYMERCQNDSNFVTQVANSFDAGIDALEDTAVRRAMFGTEEAVFWQGQVVGWKTVYSDRLLTFLLAGNRAKYRGEGEKTGGLSDEARRTLQEVFSEAAGEGSSTEAEFSSLEDALEGTDPTEATQKAAKGGKRPAKKAKRPVRELFTPIEEVDLPLLAPARGAMLPEIEVTEEMVDTAGSDFGLPSAGEMNLEDVEKMLPSAPAASAKLPSSIRRERTAPPPKKGKK